MYVLLRLEREKKGMKVNTLGNDFQLITVGRKKYYTISSKTDASLHHNTINHAIQCPDS